MFVVVFKTQVFCVPLHTPLSILGTSCWCFQHLCCATRVVPTLGWMIRMLFCFMQQYMQQQHNCWVLLLCERNAMLEQLLLDILCGPHLCACMPAVCTMLALEDDMCLLHLYCCILARAYMPCLTACTCHCIVCARLLIG